MEGDQYLDDRQDGKTSSALQDSCRDGLLGTQAADSRPAARDIGGLVDVGCQGPAEGVVHPGA